jgi:hypothetical protein
LGKGQILSQRTHNDDFTLSTLFAGNDLNMVDERPDDVDRLCSSSLVVQDISQLGDLPAVEIRKIGVELDLASMLRSFQLRIEFWPGLDAIAISLRDIVAAFIGSLVFLLLLWIFRASRSGSP